MHTQPPIEQTCHVELFALGQYYNRDCQQSLDTFGSSLITNMSAPMPVKSRITSLQVKGLELTSECRRVIELVK